MLPMDFARRLKPKDRREQAHCLLELVGLKDQWHKLPSQISGGQQQRAAIARALANQPPLLVADEPTGNLDARTSDEVFALFCRLASQGTTLVMVTHNEDLARQAPRTVTVVNGQIAARREARRNGGTLCLARMTKRRRDAQVGPARRKRMTCCPCRTLGDERALAEGHV